jgi:hypothetical protein
VSNDDFCVGCPCERHCSVRCSSDERDGITLAVGAPLSLHPLTQCRASENGRKDPITALVVKSRVARITVALFAFNKFRFRVASPGRVPVVGGHPTLRSIAKKRSSSRASKDRLGPTCFGSAGKSRPVSIHSFAVSTWVRPCNSGWPAKAGAWRWLRPLLPAAEDEDTASCELVLAPRLRVLTRRCFRAIGPRIPRKVWRRDPMT